MSLRRLGASGEMSSSSSHCVKVHIVASCQIDGTVQQKKLLICIGYWIMVHINDIKPGLAVVCAFKLWVDRCVEKDENPGHTCFFHDKARFFDF